MDAIADKLDVQVGQNDLTERLVLMSRQYGLEPQQLLQMLQQNNQLPAMFADVRRGLTVAAVVHGADRHRYRRQRDRHHGVLRPAGEQAAGRGRIAAKVTRTKPTQADEPTSTQRVAPMTRIRRHEVML